MRSKPTNSWCVRGLSFANPAPLHAAISAPDLGQPDPEQPIPLRHRPFAFLHECGHWPAMTPTMTFHQWPAAHAQSSSRQLAHRFNGSAPSGTRMPP